MSYLAPYGHYAYSSGAFSTSGVSSPPLYALADTTTANGVYVYNGGAAFPLNNGGGANYWVDPIFSPTPLVAPGAPTNVVATAGSSSTAVTWNAPPPSGGATITSYTVTPYAGSTAQPSTTVTGSPAPTSATITGLTDGTAYTFTVTATDVAGTGPASAPSSPATQPVPPPPPPPPAPPLTPTGVTATEAYPGYVNVAWTEPAGGYAPTSYTVTPYSGTTALTPTTVSGSPPATSASVNVSGGTTFTFTVTANNAAGSSAASAPSNQATPQIEGPCPCDIFGSTTPPVIDSGDPSAANVGLAFTVDSSGYIEGLRFYKGPDNTGSSCGQPLVRHWDTVGPGIVQQRDRLGLAAGILLDAGEGHPRSNLCGVVSRPERPLLDGARRRLRPRARPRPRCMRWQIRPHLMDSSSYGTTSAFPTSEQRRQQLLRGPDLR